MIEITVLVMVIMVMVVDTIVFRGLRRRLDDHIDDYRVRMNFCEMRVSSISGLCEHHRVDIKKIKRDGDLMAEHLGIEYYTKPATSTPAARCVRKKPVEGEEPTP